MRLLLTLSTLCAFAPLAEAETPWPTRGWKDALPAAEGVDDATLRKLDTELARGDHGYVSGFLVSRHGRLVFERLYKRNYDPLFASAPDQVRGPYNYYDPDWYPYYKRGTLHTLQSVSKSVTSALIGIAVGRGEIAGAHAPAMPYFEGYKVAADPRRARWKLQDLLTMTAGIRWDEDSVPYTDPANTCAAMEKSANWIQFVLDQPMAADPGTSFVYNSGVTELLAQVLKKATGKHADEYAAQHLFGPLGIEHSYWKRTPTGHPDTEGGLHLTMRDLAKIGYLYLRRGEWEGRQILPATWVAASTHAHVKESSDKRALHYGYQWWVVPDAGTPVFAAIGYGGQYLFVAPELDLITVFTAWNIWGKPSLDMRQTLQRVLAAVKPARTATRK